MKIAKNFIAGTLVGVLFGAIVGLYLPHVNSQSSTSTSSKINLVKEDISREEAELRMNMRKLWQDHVIWTRMYIISALANLQDASNVAARLMRNQEDIGNAIKPYYGTNAGNQLTTLLKEHITTATEVVKAAKASDLNALNRANQKWEANADKIADFLAKANPNLPRNEVRQMLGEHLSLTTMETNAILNKRFDEDISNFDNIHNQILEMADTLSDGIVKQFPEKF